MKTQKNIFFALATLLSAVGEQAQAQNALTRAVQSADYHVEAQAVTSSAHSPLWLNANRYGLSSVQGESAYLRLGAFRDASADSAYRFRIGYGADIAIASRFTAPFFVQQLYVDVEYGRARLTIGSREYPMELKNNLLSSGSQTFGRNARPIPQIRLEFPEYVRIFKGNDWFKIKGHIAYGRLTDGRFQESYTTPNQQYIKGVLYHSKAAYLRVGNEKRFPLVFEGGAEVGTFFGGTVYNYNAKTPRLKLPSGLGDFLRVLYMGGSDPTDGVYNNTEGNVLGSLLFSLSYYHKDWKFRAYLDHFFEDHSMLFLQYPWKDGLYGLEITPPKNPVIDGFVYEYMTTQDQSGPIFHNSTTNLPFQISAKDGYYTHGLYTGWEHWGQAIGNPLYYSPLYERNGSLAFTSNRFRAHHFGISGKPTNELSYRLLFSHIKSWGTYGTPYDDPKHQNSLLAELTYRNHGSSFLKGWSATLGFGYDAGTQRGSSTGISLTLRKTGVLFK